MEESTKKKRLQLALLLGSLGILGPFTIDTYLPAFPTIVKEFETTAPLVQISLTAALLGLGLGQLVIGPLSDVKGRKKPLLFFLGLYILASLACSISPNISLLIAARFVQGFAASGGIVISRAIVRDLYSGKELTKFFTLMVLVGNLGPIIAPIAGGAILAFQDWKWVFIVLACIGVILSITVSFKLKETLPEERRVPSNLPQVIGNFGTLFKNKEFMGYAFTQGFITAGIFAYVSGIPFVYQNIYGVTPQQFSLLFGVNGVALIIGSQSVGRLTDVISERTFLKIGLTLANISSFGLLAALLLKVPLIGVAIPVFFFLSSISMIGTSSFTLAIQSQGRMAGSASALLGVLPFVMGALAAPLVGIGGAYTGVPMAAVIFGASFLAFMCYFFLVRKTRPREPVLAVESKA
ncbi:Bcr/CflA family drug resistance efflux transporter [Neobacillus notoginsengisoli]|uniref:Bcr/CflA family efflux transporter n=1 Tax=Neobacillus notoginsengisoli TaxID=1578198 RepID=A0A417Z0S4_9BACI|nr:Bcr/CflA family multidrug efflux MFS transporter [Neobacillus notoginsengisoli]RHW43481.1 Bcr/CflA family drug resistance efflux transporter [Neobacillus notoginsengisoli]